LPYFGDVAMRMPSCTGTLIAPDVVLTAAHCIDSMAMTMGFGDVEREAYFVSRDSTLADMYEQELPPLPDDAIAASGWIKHPEFDISTLDASVNGPGNFHDIGLIFLAQPLAITPAVLISKAEAAQLVEGASV